MQLPGSCRRVDGVHRDAPPAAPGDAKGPAKVAGLLQATLAFMVLLSGLLGLVPQAGAAGSTTISSAQGGGLDQACFHHDVGAVSLIIAAGNLDSCIMFDPGERTSAGQQFATVNFNGPIPIGVNVITYGATWNSLTGCTGGSWSVSSSNGAVGSSATGSSSLTMTANDCSGYIETTASVPTVPAFVFRDRWAFNVHTPELASYVFNCGFTGMQADTQNPGTTACKMPSQFGFDCAAPSSTPDDGVTSIPCVPQTEQYQSFTTGKGVIFKGPPAVLHIPRGSSSYNAKFQYQTSIPIATYTSAGTISVWVGGIVSTCGAPSAPSPHTFAGHAGPGANLYLTDYDALPAQVLATAEDVCATTWQVYLQGTSIGIFDSAFFTTTFIKDPQTLVSGTLDTQARWCAASALGAACTTPILNAAVTGTLTVTNGGGLAVTVSGTLDNLNRFCAASATGTPCTTPTLNAALSGTTTTNLAGTVTLAGGIVLSGNLDVLNRFCAASTTGSPCLTPVVLACSTPALAADPKACTSNSNTNTTLNVGQVNSNTTQSSTFSLDIPLLDQWVPLLFWVGMLFFTYWRVNISGARYLLMFTFVILALFTAMVPGAALLSLYGGILCMVFCMVMITMLNRFGFFPAQDTMV